MKYKIACGCEIFADGQEIKCERHKSSMNKYYVAADSIARPLVKGQNADNTHADLADAIRRAENEIQQTGADIKVIVKIVAIVRREKPPVSVEVID